MTFYLAHQILSGYSITVSGRNENVLHNAPILPDNVTLTTCDELIMLGIKTNTNLNFCKHDRICNELNVQYQSNQCESKEKEEKDAAWACFYLNDLSNFLKTIACFNIAEFPWCIYSFTELL